MTSLFEATSLGDSDDAVDFERQTLIECVGLIAREVLAAMYDLIVSRSQHGRKKPNEPYTRSVDTYFVETDSLVSDRRARLDEVV